MKAIASCHGCPIGAVSGVGQGQFCPLIDRTYAQGEILYRKGDPATYIWFVKSGEVVLDAGENGSEDTHSQHKGPGSFVGLEAMVRNTYEATAKLAQTTTLCGATRAGFAQWLGPQHARTCVILRDLLELDTL